MLKRVWVKLKRRFNKDVIVLEIAHYKKQNGTQITVLSGKLDQRSMDMMASRLLQYFKKEDSVIEQNKRSAVQVAQDIFAKKP